jgi:hypothetical protein
VLHVAKALKNGIFKKSCIKETFLFNTILLEVRLL